MKDDMIIQGRTLTPKDLQFIISLIADNPSWKRKRISIEICKAWNWTTSYGQMKDMAARTMLLKLHRSGIITLPPSQMKKRRTLISKNQPEQLLFHDTTPVEGLLKSVTPLKIHQVTDKYERDLFTMYIRCYHYLGLSTIVGENLKYKVLGNNDMPLACLLFGAAAWKTAPRDKHIGWDQTTRASRLQFIANNSRFLIFPWVRVKHLASHILGIIAKRVSADWQSKYHHPIYLLETFVLKDMFKGTCYRAANWNYVGDTTGRGKLDRSRQAVRSVKTIWLYPLVRDYQAKLCTKLS